MIRRMLICAAALSLGAGAARAQSTTDFAGAMAAGVEQLGQSVGESALGGSSVFVTARGLAKIGPGAGLPYAVTIEGEAATASQAAALRDAKLDRLRAIARRFSVQMKLSDSSYAYVRPPVPRTPVRAAVPGAAPVIVPPPVAAADRPPMFTASTPVQFTRPEDAAMPAFLDALHDAGVEAFPATNTATANPFAAAGNLFGLGGATTEVDQATWDKAATAAIVAARAQAEVLASAAGRHVGEARSIMLLSKTVQGDQAVATVAVRFGFAQ